jgi:hypothetical protein
MIVQKSVPEIEACLSNNWKIAKKNQKDLLSTRYWKALLLNKRLIEHMAWKMISPYPEKLQLEEKSRRVCKRLALEG